jgi:hypothetical protein
MLRHLDTASALTITATLLLFGIALFTKGLTHDLLLEAGVFLVSVKLVLGGYKSAQAAEAVQTRLARIEGTLTRMEQVLLPSGRPPAA